MKKIYKERIAILSRAKIDEHIKKYFKILTKLNHNGTLYLRLEGPKYKFYELDNLIENGGS